MLVIPQEVRLFSYTNTIVDPDDEDEVIRITPAEVIEWFGRTCYQSYDRICEDSAAKFCKMINDRGHRAMFEACDATFKIITDRGVSHELVRHRVASYAQESTRFCKYKNGIVVIEPTQDQDYEIWHQACLFAEKSYLSLLDKGIPAQIARDVLPTCLKTEIKMKCNFREWLLFLSLRNQPAAHPKMQIVASCIQQKLVKICPEVFTF